MLSAKWIEEQIKKRMASKRKFFKEGNEMNNIERRCMPEAEIRIASDEFPMIEGYAAVFNKWTDLGYFKESIAPGAFKRAIKQGDVRALLNHDPNYVLGRNKAGTLELKEDDKGLAVGISPADTTWANDLMKSMKRGDVNQMSFGFNVIKSDDDYNKNTRILKEVNLFDVSVVTFPAYPETSAEVRALFQKQEQKQEIDPRLIEVLDKLRSGEEITEEDFEVLKKYAPTISDSATTEQDEVHSDDEQLVATPKEEQGSKHSGDLERDEGINIEVKVDPTSEILIKAERIAPKQPEKVKPKTDKWRLFQDEDNN